MQWADIVARVLVTSLLARFLQPRYKPLVSFIHRELVDHPLQSIPGQSCERITSLDQGFSSCEHFVMWERDGFEAVITGCDPNRKVWNPVMGPTLNSTSSGSLFLIPAHPSLPLYPTTLPITHSPKSPRKPIPIPIIGAPLHFNFHPLGLDLWKSNREEIKDTLFAVNWADERSQIEVFDLEVRSGELMARWVRSVQFEDGEGLSAPNSLFATSHNSFYVSFDHYFTHREFTTPEILKHQNVPPFIAEWLGGIWNTLGTLPTLLETYLLISGGKVALVDFTNEHDGEVVVREVTEHMPFPNGISLSPSACGSTKEAQTSSDYMAVALTSSSRLVILKKNDHGTFEKVNTVDLPFFPDNVVWGPLSSDGQSEILVAGHPSLRKLKKVIHDEASYAPSHTVSIGVKISSHGNVSLGPARTVYRSDGDLEKGGYGTSTTAGRDEAGRLWMSGLYVGGLMVCNGGKGEMEGDSGQLDGIE